MGSSSPRIMALRASSALAFGGAIFFDILHLCILPSFMDLPLRSVESTGPIGLIVAGLALGAASMCSPAASKVEGPKALTASKPNTATWNDSVCEPVSLGIGPDILVLGFFTLSAILRVISDHHTPPFAYVFALSGFLLLLVAGWLGSDLAMALGLAIDETPSYESRKRKAPRSFVRQVDEPI